MVHESRNEYAEQKIYFTGDKAGGDNVGSALTGYIMISRNTTKLLHSVSDGMGVNEKQILSRFSR